MNSQRQRPPYSAVLFDLDGTLTDPAVGITRCIAYALERLGAPVPQVAALRRWIGPDLRQSFSRCLGSAQRGEQALALYRERFEEVGMFENEVYPGIPALLAYLQQQGSLLLLATGKPQPYAWRILQHFDLLRHFTLVGGATLDGTVSTKTQVIAALLPRLAEVAEVEPSACVMVGDREHDIAGARAHRLPCIAVSYGYGSMHELTACAPDRLVHSVAELRALLAPCPDTGDNHERL